MIEGNIIITYHNRYYEKIGKNEPVDITDDLPFELPESWLFIRLKELAYFSGGFAFKSNKFSEFGVRVIRISDFDKNGIKNDKIVRYPYSDELLKNKIHISDILMCMTGGTVGKSLLIESLDEESYINQRVAKITSFIINQKYLFNVLSSNYVLSIINRAKNSTNDNISMDDIENFIIPLPPLKEQERIVKRIEELMPLVDKYARLEAKDKDLDDKLPGMLKQSILQYAMEGKLVKQNPDDEPASVLLDRIKLEKERLIKEGKIKRDKNESLIIQDDDKNYYENNQLFLSLDNFIRVSSGKGINVRNLDYLKKYPVYGGNGIVGTADEYLVNKNTIVIGRVGANCGCVHLTNEKAFVTDNALIVKIISSYIYNDYLLYALKSIDYKNSISSTAQPLISGKTIYMKKIYFTNMKEQKNIVHKLNQIENLINFL